MQNLVSYQHQESDVSSQINIRPVMADDKSQWAVHWEGYLTFYEARLTKEMTELLWTRIHDLQHPIRCLVAEDASTKKVVGIVHYFPHTDTWEPLPVCYLQDLFVEEGARGTGAGKALIDGVYDECKSNNWQFVYWHTHETNARARGLYDKVAGGPNGFIVYRVGSRTAASRT